MKIVYFMDLKLFTSSFESILQDLKQEHKKMLITMHRWLDGDAFGSALGLGLILRKLTIDSTVICVPFIPDKFQFLARKSKLQVVEPRKIGAEDNDGFYTTAIHEYFSEMIADYGAMAILDCAGFSQIPKEVWSIGNHLPYIINIDHHTGYHLDHPKDRVINLVGNMTSTSAILCHLMQALNVEIDPEIALPLYVGAIADLRKNNIPKTSPEYPADIIDRLNQHIRKLDQLTQEEIKDIFTLDPWETRLLDVTMTGIRSIGNVVFVAFNPDTVLKAKKETNSLHIPRMPFHEFHIKLRQKLNQYKDKFQIVVIFDQILDKVSLYDLKKTVGKIDLADISKELGDGGGHPNRAGFSFHTARNRLIQKKIINAQDSEDKMIEKMIEFIAELIGNKKKDTNRN